MSTEAKSEGRKTNKTWVDKQSEFYNSFFKKWLKDNDIEMYSIYNKRKSVVAEKFMTSVAKSVYIDKLDYIVNEYNNIYHRLIKMKPVDVKNNAYVDFSKDVNDKDSKFKVGDHVRMLKYKNFFAKEYTPN